MTVSYEKLWKPLIDKAMRNTDVLVKICTALQCDINNIMELTQESIK